MQLPASLDWLRRQPGGPAWLASLPRLLDEVAERWSLRVEPAYAGSYVSLVVPVTLPDGSPAVLKLQFPDRDSRHEAAALRHWAGGGAVRLLAHDERRYALLIERCAPGGPLAGADPRTALDVLVALLPRLWTPAGAPFAAVAGEAPRWAAALPERWQRAGHPCPRRLVDAAAATLAELAASQGEQVLLNQDLHGHNVLRAEREPWLVIDPKPLLGEREFALAPIVRDYGFGHGRAVVHHRLDRLTAELGLDRERARGWTFAHAVVQAFQDDDGMTRHLQTAAWLCP